jgi:hypothetical protein
VGDHAVHRSETRFYHCSAILFWRLRRVLPPVTDLDSLHGALDDTAMRALGTGEEILAVNGSEDIVVAHVAVVTAGEQMREAHGRGESMSWYWMRNSTDSFHSIRARVYDGRYDLGAAQAGG